LNTDQGSQFTSTEFTEPLLARGVEISMDGRVRALDNVFVERLWRTVKYDEVCAGIPRPNRMRKTRPVLSETLARVRRRNQAVP